jgi:hypothetical protein
MQPLAASQNKQLFLTRLQTFMLVSAGGDVHWRSEVPLLYEKYQE